MNIITRDKYVHRSFLKNVLKMIFLSLMIFTLIFTVPGGFHEVYAAPLEDCDLDGFDDATGVPVPWPGYDETKGDTPEGPGGIAPILIPDGTGSAGADNGSGTTDNTSGTTSGNTGGTTSGSTGSTTPGSTGGTTSGNTGSTTSGNTSGTTSGNTS